MWLYFHYRDVNSECYIITCLPTLLGDTYKESQEEKTDNASFHTSGYLNNDNIGNPLLSDSSQQERDARSTVFDARISGSCVSSPCFGVMPIVVQKKIKLIKQD